MGQPNRADIDTAATTSALTELNTAGQTMSDGWRAASAQLTGLIGQLGKGPLGAAFMAGYQQEAAATSSMVDHCCQTPGRFANAGNRGVNDYGAANDRSKAGFDAVK
ncbi:hypothetical protein [Fodinicola acaciae]|uniref:hypothetical protein n=1 Tax=Fodinicola acaciae TaxID=2681555 RepID=UPI0013D854F9|nr:hypothetical protein [Fodinicola acaciae]